MSQRPTGPLYFREPDSLLQTGYIVEGHLHNFGHVTIFTMGLWLASCTINGQEIKQKIEGGYPGSRLWIRKDVVHRFEVLRGPACYCCVYPHFQKDGTISETFTGWPDAYGIPEKPSS